METPTSDFFSRNNQQIHHKLPPSKTWCEKVEHLATCSASVAVNFKYKHNQRLPTNLI
jgi:hypothetical protein